MGLFAGKQGVIMGVANGHSIAAGVAKFLADQGASLAFSHLPDTDDRGRMEKRVRQVAEPLNARLIYPCDVSSDDSISEFFSKVAQTFGHIDFLVHSIAYAPTEDIKCATINASRQGFLQAMDISVYSFLAVAQKAQPLLRQGSSLVTMSYYGAEKIVSGYNLMGLAKAALEASVRYLANDLGPRGIRVNGISAGPIRTLAASAIGDFREMLKYHEAMAPLRRNVSAEDVGHAAGYLLSDLSRGVTGEIHHVDSGFHALACNPTPEKMVESAE